MTTVDSFYRKECEKIDAQCVDVELTFKLDESDPSVLILENPWGDTKIDLAEVVKDGETVTHMKLAPDTDPTYLQYTNESGANECISGDDLSAIISLTKLKDITASTTIEDGYGYVWDKTTNKFVLYDIKGGDGGGSSLTTRVAALETAVSGLSSTISSLQTAIATLNTRMNSTEDEIVDINDTLTKPDNVPTDATLAWGNANIYTQTDKSTGEFTHDPTTAATGDRTVNSDVS